MDGWRVRQYICAIKSILLFKYETGSGQDSKSGAGAYVAHNAEMPICQGTEYKLGFLFTISRIIIDFICRKTQNALLQCNDLSARNPFFIEFVFPPMPYNAEMQLVSLALWFNPPHTKLKGNCATGNKSLPDEIHQRMSLRNHCNIKRHLTRLALWE